MFLISQQNISCRYSVEAPQWGSSYVFQGEITRAQLFKTKDVINKGMAETLIIKYGIFADIFAEKNVSSQ